AGAVLYISPLKALINDQWDRLSRLCERLEVPVVAWHGDVSASRKHRFLTSPSGILLITPESLEALFVNRGSAVKGLFQQLRYIVVDELHAFIGSE
ncbi:DEAD/DEAH box helicase, partial [Pseudomonas viridiflava]